MASDLSFVEFIVEHIEETKTIRFRKMFGEYALYCNDKVVALICDNQLFVKPTKEGELFVGEVTKQAPYSGAKPSLLIEHRLEDKEWISSLIRITEENLPVPKPKKKKKVTK